MIFRRWRLILLLFVVAVFLLQIVWKIPLPFMGAAWRSDTVVAGAFRPVGKFVSGISEALSVKMRRYFFLSGVESENENLKINLARLKIENAALKDQAAALSGYRAALAAYFLEPERLLPARIVSQDLFPASKTVLLDKGSDQGVAVDDIVVAGEGLVGRVVEGFGGMCKVVLLVDSHFAVDSVNLRSGLRVLVSGMSGTETSAKREPFLTQVEYLENAIEMKSGDAIATSGQGGVFPSGIPVGSVEKVSYSSKNIFDKARVLPAVDFAKLSQVFIELKSSKGAP